MKKIDFETVVANLPGHVYWLDKNNVFLGCNEQQAKTIGLASRHDIVGRTITEFQTKENADRIVKINKRVMESGVPQIAEEPYLNASGETVVFLSHKVPLKNEEGEIIGLLGISFDVSNIKQREKSLVIAQKQVLDTLQNIAQIPQSHPITFGAQEWGSGTLQARFTHSLSHFIKKYNNGKPLDIYLFTSMGMNKKGINFQEDEYLEAFINLVNRNRLLQLNGEEKIAITSIKIVLTGENLYELYVGKEKAKQAEENWIQSQEKVLAKLAPWFKFNPQKDILRWKDVSKNNLYTTAYNDVSSLYERDTIFRKIINKTLLPKFSSKYTIDPTNKEKAARAVKEYLVREAALFLSFGKIICYPSYNLIGPIAHAIEAITKQKKHHYQQALYLGYEFKPISASQKKKKDRLLSIANIDILSLFLDSPDFNYSVIDCDGNYVSQNKTMAWETSSGRTNAKQVDIPSWENCKQVMKTGVKTVVEESFKDQYFLSIKQPLFDRNECVGIRVLSFNITEQKKADLLEKEALKKEKQFAEKTSKLMELMAGSIAHELRTPLRAISLGANGIIQYLPALFTAYKTAQAAGLEILTIPKHTHSLLTEALENIRTESKDAMSVIDMLFVKAGMSNLNLENIEECSMKSCIDEALERYPFDNQERKLVILPPETVSLDFIFYGKKILMIHVLFNLLKNALYFIRTVSKGEIYLWIENTAEYNLLHFKDTGAGIAPEVLPHIFERFYSKTRHGTGIGLSFARTVMESIGGSITCHSIEHEFAEFILRFPKKNLKSS